MVLILAGYARNYGEILQLVCLFYMLYINICGFLRSAGNGCLSYGVTCVT